MTPILLGLAAGLALFLFAIGMLADGLRSLAGHRLEQAMQVCTRNLGVGILFGIVATALLGSSSVAIVLLIALVDARVLRFPPAVGVVMGCNIGTTVKSQLVALNVGDWLAIPLVAGFLLMFAAKEARRKNLGQVIFGVGLVFFGISAMEQAVEPLKAHERWLEWLTHLESPWKGAIAGAIVSAVIQSSSGTVAMVIAFATQGLMTLPAAIAIMLGAELGTCADTLVASLGRSRAAFKIGLFHLGFNLVAVILGLLLIEPFMGMVNALSASADLPRAVANAHLLFNVASVAILGGAAPWYRLLLDRLLPEPAGRR